MARILVIDDQDSVRETLQRMLTSGGHDVVVAGGGEAGLQSYRDEPADVVFVDLFMPEMDGADFTGRLRGEFPEAKVVLMTGRGWRYLEMHSLARDVRVDRMLPKPFGLDELQLVIRELIDE